MHALRILLRKNTHQLRQIHKCAPHCQAGAAAAATPAPTITPVTEKLTFPVPEGTEKPVSAKVDKIAQEITSLNLLEVAELSDVLKKRLNLPDAPVMPVGGFAVAAPAKDEEEAPKAAVKTSFTARLTKFDEKQKVPIIKEIKNLIAGMNLVQAKKFVESVPQVLKADVSKEEAEQLKAALEKVGGEVVID